jgi:Rrf2 family transcriptional regulator, cysteine metabolism repressor
VKITYKGDYAMKILLDLALHYQKGLSQLKDISKRQDIPLRYLGQIILSLKSAGYVRSKRGHDGGVELSKPPDRITLGEIIRLMDGTTSPITCISLTKPSKCDFSKACPFRPIWSEVRETVNGIVDKTTFADMVDKYTDLPKNYGDYMI